MKYVKITFSGIGEAPDRLSHELASNDVLAGLNYGIAQIAQFIEPEGVTKYEFTYSTPDMDDFIKKMKEYIIKFWTDVTLVSVDEVDEPVVPKLGSPVAVDVAPADEGVVQ